MPAIAVLLFLVAAGVGYLRARPVVSDEEVDNAIAWLDTERATMLEESCPRAPLRGEATTGDGSDAFRALFSYRTCLEAVDDDAVTAAFAGSSGTERSWHWDVPDSTPELGPPMPDGWGALHFAKPPYPEAGLPPALRAVVDACRELPERLRAVTAHESVCAPWRASAAPLRADLFSFARALAVLARRAVARGDPLAGFNMLFDGVRFFHDARRGSVGLVSAMAAVGAESIVWAQVQTLLGLQLDLDEEARASLRDQLTCLAETTPHPAAMVRGEQVLLASHSARSGLGWEPSEGFEDNRELLDIVNPNGTMSEAEHRTITRVVLVALHGQASDLNLACSAVASPAACLRGLRELDAQTPSELPPEWMTQILGRRYQREEAIAMIQSGAARGLHVYVARALRSVAVARGVRVLVSFGAERDDGACPGTAGLLADDLDVPELDGRLRVYELAPDAQFELHAPPILSEAPPGTVSLPILLAMCPGRTPATAGRWVQANLAPPDSPGTDPSEGMDPSESVGRLP